MIAEDECVEVTPSSVRLRKVNLDQTERAAQPPSRAKRRLPTCTQTSGVSSGTGSRVQSGARFSRKASRPSWASSVM